MKLCPVCQRCYEDTDAVCSFDNASLVSSRHGSRMITDKYRLDRLLGRGGMGAVYEATHIELERVVAVKLLLPDFTADVEALERFRREARAAARLNHPNVADTYDYGSLPDGGAYIVMELVEGQTLRERMNEGGALPFGEAIMVARQVAKGVAAAHRNGITHRDLKPSNIILTRDHDEHVLAKVVDFSVAKLKEGTTSGTALTATGSLIGTPRYMAPEQCADNKTDERSDIYSLGVILYEMIAGRPPFDGPTTTAIAIKHIQEPPPPIEQLRPDVPVGLRNLIMQSLAKSPSERPQTAQEFGSRLDEAALELPATITAPQTSSSLSASGAQAEKAATQTNPQTTEHGPETGRTGEPTREDPASTVPESDPLSVQAHAVSMDELDKEAETKVSASTARAQGEALQEAEGAEMDDEKEAIGSGAASQAEAASQSEKEFPLLSRHKPIAEPTGTVEKIDTTQATESTAIRGRVPAPSRSNYLLWAAALAVVITIGIGAFLLASRQTSNSDQANNATTNRNEKSATTTANSANSETTNNSGTLSDSGAAATPLPSETGPVDVRSELRTLRDQWVNATVSSDLNRLISFYPPVMETFYLKRNVPLAAVRAEKQRLIEQATTIEIRTGDPEISVSPDGRSATMTFRKSWNFQGSQPSSGEVIQELRWIKTGAGWKITSERDLGVIR